MASFNFINNSKNSHLKYEVLSLVIQTSTIVYYFFGRPFTDVETIIWFVGAIGGGAISYVGKQEDTESDITFVEGLLALVQVAVVVIYIVILVRSWLRGGLGA